MSIAQRYCRETFDEAGVLRKFDIVCPENFNFGYDVVDVIAEETPEKTALVWCNTENEEHIFSFADISRMSNQMANALRRGGVGQGDRVMVVLKRHYEYWPLAVALHKLGATMIPATHMLTERDYVYRLQKAAVTALVCTYQDEVPQKVLAALAQTKMTCKCWTVGREVEGFANLNQEMANQPTDFPRVPTKTTDPMLLYFTSGTTGYPKGVMHDFAYPLAHIVTARYWHQAQEGGLHFTVAETGWAKASWGKIYGQWLVGSAVMVYDFDNFEPRQLTTIINQYGVTSFCAPPTVYRYLVRKGIPKMPTLCHATTAGEMLAPDVFRRFTESTGIPLCEGYGQTETTLLTANFKDSPLVPGSMGMPSPFYHIDLRSRTGAEVAEGEIGEVVIIPPESGRQPGIFCGYLGEEEQYKRVWRDGVYHTGDAAYRDETGRYWFHGRFDDIIKTGGFRVGPYEIEHILAEHPAVCECSAVGVADPLRGQAIKAVILLNAGYAPSKELEKEIKDFCNSRLAEYKWVRLIEFVTDIPKTISGKVRRVEIREKG